MRRDAARPQQEDGFASVIPLPRPGIPEGFLGGLEWLDSLPERLAPVWGEGERVLWSSGEPLLLAGPTGVGKTTITGQLLLGLIGRRTQVLGFPVFPVGRVLYLSADRPQQALRSIRRMVVPADRDAIRDRLVVWQGPPLADVTTDPQVIARMAAQAGADAVFVDSLKDVAFDLASDQTGSKVARAMQSVVSEGRELFIAHHMRKRQQGGAVPNELSDVYGSSQITNTAGSVIVLWGEAGDSVVDFRHLKQPAEKIENLKISHDHSRGVSTVAEVVDLILIAKLLGASGLTAQVAARHLAGRDQPTAADIEKARRKLRSHEQMGQLVKHSRSGAADIWIVAE